MSIYQLSTQAGQGRPILGSKLYAVGQQNNATDLQTVKLMGATDEAAHFTEQVLDKLERYSDGLRFYDGRENDRNSEPGKVAVTDATVRGEISCWNWRTQGVMEFDPVTRDTRSLDIEVSSAPTEHFRLHTSDDGVKHLSFQPEWGDGCELSIDRKTGLITVQLS